jgi:hypothetical protein
VVRPLKPVLDLKPRGHLLQLLVILPNRYRPVRLRVDQADGDVQMQMRLVGVQRRDALMGSQAKAGNQRVLDRLDLRARG